MILKIEYNHGAFDLLPIKDWGEYDKALKFLRLTKNSNFIRCINVYDEEDK